MSLKGDTRTVDVDYKATGYIVVVKIKKVNEFAQGK